MKKHKILLILFVLALFSCTNKIPKKTNIVLIFADDLGYADVGCYGAKGYETPNLDRMANEGIKFSNFYCATAVCSASRAALLTGCYPERVSLVGALFPNSEVGLNPNEQTIAEVLKEQGYATAIYGKWHLGDAKEFLPLQQGFDEYFGIPYSNDMWPVYYDGTPATEKNVGPKHWKLKAQQLPIISGNDKALEIKDLDGQAMLTTLYTEKAVGFIKRHKSDPFFLYVPHSMPHVPLGVSDKFKGKSEQGMYGDVLMEIDWSVGQILKTLKETGNEDNTLVIFTSDNGPWLNYGNHAGSAGKLREGKGAMWEGGHRVPCIMKWPGKIPAGKTITKLASTIDFLPTFASIANGGLPDNKIDGINILPLIEGEDVNPREEFWCYYNNELRAVRKEDWKLYFPHEYRSYSDVTPGNDGFPGPYSFKNCELELYNLKNDIGETNNLVNEYPDIVEQLQKLADQARSELGDKLTGEKGNNVRPVGRLNK